MKRQMTGVLASLAVAIALVTVTAQQQQEQQQEQQKPMEVTLTGCLIQGSAPTVFVLSDAKIDPENREETGRSYVVISRIEDTDLTEFLNHQVRITGSPEEKPVVDPQEQQTEANLPKLTATALVDVADTCPSALR